MTPRPNKKSSSAKSAGPELEDQIQKGRRVRKKSKASREETANLTVPPSPDTLSGGKGQAKMTKGAPPVGQDFANAALEELVETFVPLMPDEAIERLEDLIRRAQATPPQDTKAFVASVNCLLHAHSIRLETVSYTHLTLPTILLV